MKGYTSLEQSKKLAEILPKESADMGWYYSCNTLAASNQMWAGTKPENADIPCWSLAALLKILKDYQLFSNGLIVYIDNDSYRTASDNPVDACYEMILKLYELKLL